MYPAKTVKPKKQAQNTAWTGMYIHNIPSSVCPLSVSFSRVGHSDPGGQESDQSDVND